MAIGAAEGAKRATSVAPPARARTAPGVAVAHSAVRPEIQAIRAAAVVLVVLYHVSPRALPGGFIGVDVFFAISGFLITTQLLREVDRDGDVSLASFWARRARRILPAALFVLVASAAATLAFVPHEHWQQYLREISASTAYVQNWQLAASSVDYLQAADAPSPVEHFWSLSAEEQFYLVWPLLILLALFAVRRRPSAVRRRAIGVAFGALAVASLGYSVYQTHANPSAAYFVTPTRAWEFAAGGLLALARPTAETRHGLRSALSWAGIAAIVVAALTFDERTPFPGVAAVLPVVGTLAVMQAGAPSHRLAPTPVLRLPPVQFIGDVSYSVYLWHWPLLIILPFALHRAPGTTEVLALALTVLAAWLTKRFVEDPMRATGFLVRARPRRTLAFAAVATVVVFLVPMGGKSVLQNQLDRDRRASDRILASHPACFGAVALDPLRQPCKNPRLRLVVVPTPLEAAYDGNSPCADVETVDLVEVCEFGVVDGSASTTVALVGDSHASHWRAALDVVARRKRWHGLSITRTGCPFTTTVKALAEPARSECLAWNAQVPAWLARHPEVRTVFVSHITGGKVSVPPGMTRSAAEVAGFRQAWATLPASVERVIVIRDPPKVRGTTRDCVERARERHVPAGPACAVPRSSALRPDPAVAAASGAGAGRAQAVDLTRFLCPGRTCRPVVGGALVYKDVHHLTSVYATTLGRFLLRDIDALPASPGS